MVRRTRRDLDRMWRAGPLAGLALDETWLTPIVA